MDTGEIGSISMEQLKIKTQGLMSTKMYSKWKLIY